MNRLVWGVTICSLMTGTALAHKVNPMHPTPTMIAAGKKLVFSRSKGNCIACHQVKGAVMAGDIAQPLQPPFPDPQKLYMQIWDARDNYQQTIMPPYGANHLLTRGQIKDIMAYLYSLD